MNRYAIAISLGAAAITASACHRDTSASATGGGPIGEADAARIADATVATWSSMDAAKIKALYGADVAGFDYARASLASGRAAWDKAQDAFAAAKMDKYVQRERKIQILDADTFVMSGVWDGSSKAIPANNGAVRCTDVFERAADGSWPIVNEHCSVLPKTV